MQRVSRGWVGRGCFTLARSLSHASKTYKHTCSLSLSQACVPQTLTTCTRVPHALMRHTDTCDTRLSFGEQGSGVRVEGRGLRVKMSHDSTEPLDFEHVHERLRRRACGLNDNPYSSLCDTRACGLNGKDGGYEWSGPSCAWVCKPSTKCKPAEQSKGGTGVPVRFALDVALFRLVR